MSKTIPNPWVRNYDIWQEITGHIRAVRSEVGQMSPTPEIMALSAAVCSALALAEQKLQQAQVSLAASRAAP